MTKREWTESSVRKQLRVSPEFLERVDWIIKNSKVYRNEKSEAAAIKKAVQVYSDKLGFTPKMF